MLLIKTSRERFADLCATRCERRTLPSTGGDCRPVLAGAAVAWNGNGKTPWVAPPRRWFGAGLRYGRRPGGFQPGASRGVGAIQPPLRGGNHRGDGGAYVREAQRRHCARFFWQRLTPDEVAARGAEKERLYREMVGERLEEILMPGLRRFLQMPKCQWLLPATPNPQMSASSWITRPWSLFSGCIGWAPGTAVPNRIRKLLEPRVALGFHPELHCFRRFAFGSSGGTGGRYAGNWPLYYLWQLAGNSFAYIILRAGSGYMAGSPSERLRCICASVLFVTLGAIASAAQARPSESAPAAATQVVVALEDTATSSLVFAALFERILAGVFSLEPRTAYPQPAPSVAQDLPVGRRNCGGRFTREHPFPPHRRAARNPGRHPRPFVHLQPRHQGFNS